MLGERAHGEKSQFGKQRWNHNLWSPFCPCRPVIPTAIKGKEREATGKSNKSRLRVDALTLTNKCIAFFTYGKVPRKRQRGGINWDSCAESLQQKGIQMVHNKIKHHLISLLLFNLKTMFF